MSQPLVLVWGLPIVAAIVILGRKSLSGLVGRRALLAAGLRLAVIFTLFMALGGLQLQWATRDRTILFLVDRSDSVSSAERDRALSIINQTLAVKSPRDQVGVLGFGADAVVEREPSPLATPLDRFRSQPADTSYTDIARALRLGLGLLPSTTQNRIVILSDGNENLGQALTQATLAAGREIPVDVIILQAGEQDEVLVDSVAVPERLEENKPFDVRVTVVSTRRGPGTLRLFRNRTLVAQSSVELQPGRNTFVIPQTETESGFNTYEATVDAPADTLRDNNSASAFSLVQGESRVLLVGRPEDTGSLAQALIQQNLPTDQAETLPNSAPDLQRYGAVYLVNTSAEQFSLSQMSLVRNWMAELGGGLGMIGGPDSFALGGWNRTPVEEVLPVTMELKDKRNFPSLGLILLIDKSGSMMGGLPGSPLTKLEVAVEAAVLALEQLTERDYVGVIGFDSAAKWDVPFQRASDKKRMADQIRSLRPGGGTDAIPAFRQAIEALGSTPLQQRHVLFLTDGVVVPGDYDAITRELNRLQATVTAIGIGTDTDAVFLSGLAAANNGRFYLTSDPNRVPLIFTKETILAQRNYLVEEAFQPVVTADNQILRGLSGLPNLLGYVNAEAKDRAEVILRSHRDDPLLATWRFRAGKSLAWTSDARDRWSARWLGWPGFRQFWEQSTRWLLPLQQPSTLLPRLVLSQGEGRILVDAVEASGQTQNFLELDATVLTPNQEVKRVRLRQTGAGQYEGTFPARESGSYLISVGGAGVEPATAGASLSYPPEYRTTRPNGLLLSQIASITGGRVDPAALDILRPLEQQATRKLDLLPWLLGAALALLLADIMARRLFLDEEQKAQLAAWFSPLLAPLRWMGRVASLTKRNPNSSQVQNTLASLRARQLQQQRLRELQRGDSGEQTSATKAGIGTRDRTEAPSFRSSLDQLSSSQTGAPGSAARGANQIASLQNTIPATPSGKDSGSAAAEAPGSRLARLREAREKARQKRGDGIETTD
jgi:uncharacterized membrane protein